MGRLLATHAGNHHLCYVLVCCSCLGRDEKLQLQIFAFYFPKQGCKLRVAQALVALRQQQKRRARKGRYLESHLVGRYFSFRLFYFSDFKGPQKLISSCQGCWEMLRQDNDLRPF